MKVIPKDELITIIRIDMAAHGLNMTKERIDELFERYGDDYYFDDTPTKMVKTNSNQAREDLMRG